VPSVGAFHYFGSSAKIVWFKEVIGALFFVSVAKHQMPRVLSCTSNNKI